MAGRSSHKLTDHSDYVEQVHICQRKRKVQIIRMSFQMFHIEHPERIRTRGAPRHEWLFELCGEHVSRTPG